MNDEHIKTLSHEHLVALVIELQKENQFLKEQLAKATKNSTNSSKRPSSDIVKPKKQKKASGKKTKKRRPARTSQARKYAAA